MCPRTKLEVILKFSLNGELLCGAWLLKSFQQKKGERILSYSRNSAEIEASLERRATWLARIRREDLVDDATEFYRVCGDHFVSGT